VLRLRYEHFGDARQRPGVLAAALTLEVCIEGSWPLTGMPAGVIARGRRWMRGVFASSVGGASYALK
jgi:hypothetical protein